jgi:hypothetical protein
MKRRLHFPAFTYAWLATLATFPLLVATANFAVGASATLNLVQLVALSYSGYVTAWMIPTTVLGLLAWPLTRVMLERSAGRRAAWLARLTFGAFLGATAGLVLALALAVIPWIILGMRDEMPIGPTMWAMILGSATGLVWAAWFLLFAKLIGADRPEAPVEDPAAPQPGNS